MGPDIGGLIFFSAMREYIKHQLESNLADGLNRVIGFVGVIALTILTLWIMIEGYRIMTGQSRTPLIAFIVNAGKAVMIVTIATSSAVYNDWVVDTVDDFRDEVTYLITGSNQDVYRQVDKNLALTQTMLSTISSLARWERSDAAGDSAEAKKAWYIGAFGGAGPAIVGGMVSLVNEIMVHFGVMLGPLFILGLLFEQTKQLFWQWVKSMLGLMVSMGVLAFLSGLVMKISIGYTAAAATAIAIDRWLPGVKGALNTPSIMETMMVQGGVGLLLSTLLITIPPAVNAFVGGTLGAGVNAFTPWGKTGGNPGAGEPAAPTTDGKAGTEGQAGTSDQARTDSNHMGRSTGGSIDTPGGAPQVAGRAETAPPDLKTVQASLAAKGASGYAMNENGNVYRLGGDEERRSRMADHGYSVPVSADVKALLRQQRDLQS
ncbi:type IV secretion system protein [Budviciaceae bacterium CWB-B4]|uniref:Type IV secretion system protein n=1 Tax=Limnobaculum xujianqingii TaxID=2738837 RepID=A0A9D7FQD0_9GAMM|nr:type IV secretion system protein [Limnobaculum xujianqingii]MBK5071623.1 type IV secretion system protein [Limnobaculum xujianqingii]MBK5174932.1 type IV secretion system protein [Limnobaculum xujianqingii]